MAWPCDTEIYSESAAPNCSTLSIFQILFIFLLPLHLVTEKAVAAECYIYVWSLLIVVYFIKSIQIGDFSPAKHMN